MPRPDIYMGKIHLIGAVPDYLCGRMATEMKYLKGNNHEQHDQLFGTVRCSG